ncbi:NUDIX hydrolase [Bryobacterales bacterium F-183]|nr:NUDIX hydrolase [Bryobacterales bacterium F-183]
MNIVELRAQIAAWTDATDGEAMKSRDLILSLLDGTPEPFARHQFAPGHITATGMVLHPDQDAVLTVHHKRLDRWLLPGGHVEAGDTDIFAAAAREVLEETAAPLVDAVAPYIAGLDVHSIPGNAKEPYHLHHDVVIGFVAASEVLQVSEESCAVAWRRPDEFDAFGIPGNVRRAFAKRRVRL